MIILSMRTERTRTNKLSQDLLSASGTHMKLSVSIVFNAQMMMRRQIGAPIYCLADLPAGKPKLPNGPKTYQASCSAEESH